MTLEIFREAKKRNLEEKKLFSFVEWQRYIECRRSVLINSHFPTRVKYSNQLIHDHSHMYLNFQKIQNSKKEELVDLDPEKVAGCVSREISDRLRQAVESIDIKVPLTEELEIMDLSLTPMRSYIQQLLQNPLSGLPYLLEESFTDDKVGYLTKLDK